MKSKYMPSLFGLDKHGTFENQIIKSRNKYLVLNFIKSVNNFHSTEKYKLC